MNSFIAAPNTQYHVGQPICRSKRRCDVVSNVGDSDGEESCHYYRTCTVCGESWWSLHCIHDGHQNPCPNGHRNKPVPDNVDADYCCEFDTEVFIRPMTWWESLKHELFGECESNQ